MLHTGEPAPLVETELSAYISKRRDTPKDCTVHILEREGTRFERRVKKAIYVKTGKIQKASGNTFEHRLSSPSGFTTIHALDPLTKIYVCNQLTERSGGSATHM